MGKRKSFEVPKWFDLKNYEKVIKEKNGDQKGLFTGRQLYEAIKRRNKLYYAFVDEVKGLDNKESESCESVDSLLRGWAFKDTKDCYISRCEVKVFNLLRDWGKDYPKGRERLREKIRKPEFANLHVGRFEELREQKCNKDLIEKELREIESDDSKLEDWVVENIFFCLTAEYSKGNQKVKELAKDIISDCVLMMIDLDNISDGYPPLANHMNIDNWLELTYRFFSEASTFDQSGKKEFDDLFEKVKDWIASGARKKFVTKGIRKELLKHEISVLEPYSVNGGENRLFVSINYGNQTIVDMESSFSELLKNTKNYEESSSIRGGVTLKSATKDTNNILTQRLIPIMDLIIWGRINGNPLIIEKGQEGHGSTVNFLAKTVFPDEDPDTAKDNIFKTYLKNAKSYLKGDKTVKQFID